MMICTRVFDTVKGGKWAFVSGRRRTQRLGLVLATSVLLVPTALAPAEDYLSNGTGGGPWRDRDTWIPRGKPGSSDTATIIAFDVVTWGSGSNHLSVAELTISGDATLTSDPDGGWNGVTIKTPVLRNYGSIIATSDSPSAFAGDIKIYWFNGPFTYVNAGTIAAGPGGERFGGDVHFWAHSVGVVGDGTLTNTGTILSGSSDTIAGDVRIWLTGAFINGADGVVSAGGSTEAFGGDINISLSRDLDADPPVPGGFMNAGTILAGDSASGIGGDVHCYGSKSPWTNTGTIIAGDGGAITGDVQAYGDPKINTGVVAGGAPLGGGFSGDVDLDPPQGEISGDAQVLGGDIDLVGGELLTITNLANVKAIKADNDLRITLAAGGTLDFRGIDPSFIRLSAGNSVTIWADDIALDPGVFLSDFISPSPTVGAGRRFTQISMQPGGTVAVPIGDTLDFAAIVANNGNGQETIDYQISDSLGWLTSPTQGTVILEPVASEFVDMPIFVPANVPPGTTSTITLHAQTQGTGGVDTTELLVVATPNPSQGIPAVSEWGLIVMTLLVLTAGTLVYARRRPVHA